MYIEKKNVLPNQSACGLFVRAFIVNCDAEFGNSGLIAKNVSFLNRDDHRFDIVGKTLWDSPRGDSYKVVVEDDVWIGHGATGLSILDSFALGQPYFTTDCQMHGPEIEYLEPGKNGILTVPSVSEFASMVISVLKDKETLKAMQCAAFSSGSRYTIENMAQNFAAGVLQALETK